MNQAGQALKSFFRPTRVSKFNFKKPLIVTPLLDRNELIKNRFRLNINEFLGEAVATVNGSNAQGPLKYRDNIPSSEGYFRFSKDPFGFYETSIHKDDWNDYMTVLGQNGPPIRPFISLEDKKACEALDKILTAVGQRDTIIQSRLSKEDRSKLGLNPDQDVEDIKDAKAFYRRKVNVTTMQKRLLGIECLDKNYGFKHGSARIQVDLDIQKMSDAVGKRGKEQSQKGVMGNFAAAEIAKPLNWESTRLKGGCFPSEWLHLSAFSWGGFMPLKTESDESEPDEPEPDETQSGFSTSQNLENLVFGTSETNSLMTRYEMAWQDFFRFEQQIHNEAAQKLNYNPQSLTGALEVLCNDFGAPIYYDHYDSKSKRYSLCEFTLNPGLVQEVKNVAIKNMQSKDPKLMCTLMKSSSSAPAQMLAIAHDFPFIVYSIKYAIRANFDSFLLGGPSPGGVFCFYPFQRSLYHEAEAELDSLILGLLKKGAHAALEQKLAQIQNPELAQQKENQDWVDNFREVWAKRSADLEKAKKDRNAKYAKDYFTTKMNDRIENSSSPPKT